MRSLRFSTKMIIFSFVLATLPVIFIGAFSYSTSSREIQKYANEGEIQMLRQTNANVEQVLKTVNHTLNQVINSSTMRESFNTPLHVTDFKTYGNLQTEIRYMQSFDTKVEDVLLINVQQNWMIKNSGIYRFDQYEYYEELGQLLQLPYESSWVLTPSHWFYSEESANSVRCPTTISLVKKLPTIGLQTYGLVMANITTCDLRSFIQYDADELNRFIILDENDLILMHPDDSLIGQPAESAGLQTVNLANDFSGQFQTELDGERQAVTYLKSRFNNWTYLSVISIDSLTRQSDRIGMYTIVLCASMLLVSLILSWVISRRMYLPIGKLVREITEKSDQKPAKPHNEFQLIGEHVQHLFQSKSRLEQEVSQHIQQVRTFLLIRAFQGNVRKSNLVSKLIQYGYEHQVKNWKSMTVIALQIDTLKNTNYSKNDSDLLLFAVHNIIEELVPDMQRLSPVQIDSTVVTMVGNEMEDLTEYQRWIYWITEQLQQNIRTYLHLQVSIGLSLPFHVIQNLSGAYQESLEALKHRIKLGDGIIIQFENISSGKHYLNFNYPYVKESELMDAIKLGERDKARQKIQQIMQSIFKVELSPQEYQLPLARLLNNLLILLQESRIKLSELYQSHTPLFEELFQLQLAYEIEDWFWDRLIEPMISIHLERQDKQYHNISEKIIELIYQRFDTDLTLEECAALLHYNANYLSSVFRKETNYSFSEYLASFRLNMAKKWLAETDMTIKDIATRLRYNNSQNFIRSFRKQEGLTPGQYRENILRR